MRSSIKAADFGMDPLEFNEQENELQKKEQENLELTVRELAVTINELESENSDLQGQIYHLKKRLSNGVVDRRGSVDSLDEMNVLRDEIEALNEVIQQKDNELEEMNHLKEQLEDKDERLRLIEKEFMEMLTPTFKAAKADTFYRMVPSSIKQHSTHLQIDSTTSVMGRLKSFLGSDDSEKLKKELIKMVRLCEYFSFIFLIFLRWGSMRPKETAPSNCSIKSSPYKEILLHVVVLVHRVIKS